MKPTKHEEEIIALRAQLEAMVATKKAARTRGGGGIANTSTIINRSTGGKRTFRGKGSWRNITPKVGEPHSKTHEGDTWHYCTHHGYWAAHKSSECEMEKKRKASQTKQDGITAAMAEVGVEDVYEDDEASQE